VLTNFQERNQPQIHPDVEYRVHTKDLAKVKVNGDVILVSNKNGFIDYETSFFSVVLRSYEYRRPSLYAIDRDLKNRLAYNEIAYKETKSIGKLEDTFL